MGSNLAALLKKVFAADVIGLFRTLSNTWNYTFCENSEGLLSVIYIRKTFHLRCLTGFPEYTPICFLKCFPKFLEWMLIRTPLYDRFHRFEDKKEKRFTIKLALNCTFKSFVKYLKRNFAFKFEIGHNVKLDIVFFLISWKDLVCCC